MVCRWWSSLQDKDEKIILSRIFFILCALYLTLEARGYEPFLSFSASKSALIKIYAEHKKLPISGCDYFFDPKGCSIAGIVDLKSCDYKIKNDPIMARQVQWMHVLDPYHFGEEFSCLTKRECRSSYSKKIYKGIRCCKQKSAKFKKMYADMHNIIPVIGAFRKLRQGRYLKEARELEAEKGVVTPDDAKGTVARAYLYMIKTYDIKMPKRLKQMWLRWHKEHPVTSWEKKKKHLIFKLQDTSNWYIQAI